MLTNSELVTFLRPTFDALFPLTLIVVAIPFLAIIFNKILEFKKAALKGDSGDKNFVWEGFKVLIFMIVVFSWVNVFSLIFKAGDMGEALIYRFINVQELYPDLTYTETDSATSVLDKLHTRLVMNGRAQHTKEHYDEASRGTEKRIEFLQQRIEEEEIRKSKRGTSFDWRAVVSGLSGKAYSIDELNQKSDKKISNWMQEIDELEGKLSVFSDQIKYAPSASDLNEASSEDVLEKAGDRLDGVWRGLQVPVEFFLVKIIVMVSNIIGHLIYFLRDGLSIIFLLLGPSIIALSYFPLLGDQEDQKGLNQRSITYINWVVVLAFFPTIFAVKDQAILIMFYIYSNNHMLESIDAVTGFFMFNMTLSIALPWLIHSLNPMGIMNGFFSSASSLLISSSVLTSTMTNMGGLMTKYTNKLTNLDLMNYRKDNQ